MSIGGNSQSGNTSQQYNQTSTGNSTTNQSSNGSSNYNPNNLTALMQGWGAAGGLLNNGWGSLVNNGMNMTGAAGGAATALNGAGATNAEGIASGAGTTNGANQYLTPTASGANITADPHFQDVLDTYAKGAQSATDGAFGAAGRYGSGANANAFNSAVANESGNLAYGNFQQQEQNQLAAAGQLSNNNATGVNQQIAANGQIPGLVASQFTPGAATSAAGYGSLQNYINAITAGNGGGTTTNQQTGTANTQGTQTTNGTATGQSNSNGFNWNVNLASLLGAFA